MNLEKDLIITLEDGNEYYIISTAMYNNEKYAYLMNMKEDNDYIYVKEINSPEGLQIKLVTDEELIKKIALYLQKEIV